MTIFQFNNLLSADAQVLLYKCCASHTWVNKMLLGLPYNAIENIYENAEMSWKNCSMSDYLEAFSGHPKIGDVNSLNKKFANTANWAGNEQSSMEVANTETINELALGNELYAKKFGFIFIVFATGKSGAEMLTLLNNRIHNELETEIKIAAAEQLKITILRLRKMLND